MALLSFTSEKRLRHAWPLGREKRMGTPRLGICPYPPPQIAGLPLKESPAWQPMALGIFWMLAPVLPLTGCQGPATVLGVGDGLPLWGLRANPSASFFGTTGREQQMGRKAVLHTAPSFLRWFYPCPTSILGSAPLSLSLSLSWPPALFRSLSRPLRERAGQAPR